MIYPVFQFNLSTFFLSFLATEAMVIKFPNLRLFVIHGKRKFAIHHAYVGFLLALTSSLFGQVALLNIGLGAIFGDISCHFRKFIRKKFK